MSHTWKHKQFKKRYPGLSQYVKVGKPLNLEDLPPEVVKAEDYKGLSYDNLEGRLQVLMSKSKVKK
jgi:hypothetical protein